MTGHRMVDVYNTDTGKKLPNPVPERWLDHPVLGQNLAVTPSARHAITEPEVEPAPEVEPDLDDYGYTE